MQIWVDADAVPKQIKELLCRAADRTQTRMTFVANQNIPLPPSKFTQSLQVPKGFDIADNEIVRRCEAGDLVVTQDIPLADEVITKGCHAMSTRGDWWTKENIKQRLNMRDFFETMRSSGIQTGGPNAMNNQDVQKFANKLDAFLARHK
jgi:uncharacterized protein YaiI (UPF0178 family)